MNGLKLRYLLDDLQPVHGKVLDVGCGAGSVAKAVKQARPDLEVVGCDVSKAALAIATASPQGVEFRAAQAERLPFEDGEFDFVWIFDVLEHVEDPDGSLAEIRRILRPGGAFYCFKLPNRHSYLERIAKAAGLYYHGQDSRDRLYTMASARALLTRHGFTVLELRRANMLPLTVTGPVAQRAARAIWGVNRGLARVPGLNAVATNVELVARTPRS